MHSETHRTLLVTTFLAFFSSLLNCSESFSMGANAVCAHFFWPPDETSETFFLRRRRKRKLDHGVLSDMDKKHYFAWRHSQIQNQYRWDT
jgi:hypothetical protein